MTWVIEVRYFHSFYTSNVILANISSGVDSLPCKEQTPTEILVSEEVEESPLKRKKSSRNKEHIPDGGERKKRSKQSKERKKSEGNEGNIIKLDFSFIPTN